MPTVIFCDEASASGIDISEPKMLTTYLSSLPAPGSKWWLKHISWQGALAGELWSRWLELDFPELFENSQILFKDELIPLPGPPYPLPRNNLRFFANQVAWTATASFSNRDRSKLAHLSPNLYLGRHTLTNREISMKYLTPKLFGVSGFPLADITRYICVVLEYKEE